MASVDDATGDVITLTHSGLVNNTLAFGHQLGETIRVYTGPSFKPSFMMILRRQSVDGDQHVERLPTSFLAELAYNFTDTETDDLAELDRDSWWGEDLESRVADAIEHQRIQIYEFKAHELARLKDAQDPLFSPPKPSASKALTNADPSLEALRAALASELGGVLVNRWRTKEAKDSLFHSQNIAQQRLIQTGAFLDGGMDTVVSGVEATWDLATYAVTSVDDAAVAAWQSAKAFADRITDAQWEDITNAVEQAGIAIKASAKELKEKLEQGYAMFERLMSDAATRRMITDFFAGYMASTADTAWANQAGKVAVNIGVEFLIALATAGYGNIVSLTARGVGRIAQFSARAIDLMADVYRKLSPRRGSLPGEGAPKSKLGGRMAQKPGPMGKQSENAGDADTGSNSPPKQQSADANQQQTSDNDQRDDNPPQEDPELVTDGGEPIDEPSEKSSKPEWLKRIEEGREFNERRRPFYEHNELYIEKADGDGYWRVDSYEPSTGEIVERKYTQLSDIDEDTAKSYVNELSRKYSPGSKIAEVPSSGDLGGQRLQGQMILEVPPQNQPPPQAIQETADSEGVIIRDTQGNGLN